MKFDKLNDMIPYVTGGKAKVLSMSPYNAITLRLPGRHAKDTDPVGGDFVVCVDDEDMNWTAHQFTHTDLFIEVEKYKARYKDRGFLDSIVLPYLLVVQGESPTKHNLSAPDDYHGMHPQTFLYAVQCLAVAEHRRYARFENKFGGRYLPFRFAAGIEDGLWTAAEASDKQKYGRPAVERLEKERGTPILTKELMK